MLYNLYYTLNINLPDQVIDDEKRRQIVERIENEENPSKNQMYILLILEHACHENLTTRDDILKGILPFEILVDGDRIYVNDEKLPDKLLYILEKSLNL